MVVRAGPNELRGGGSSNFFLGQISEVAKPRARVCGAGARTRGVRGHAPPEIFEKMVKICAIWCILGHVLRGDNSIVFGAKTSKSPSHNRSCSHVKISVVVLAIGVRGHVLPEKKEKKKEQNCAI